MKNELLKYNDSVIRILAENVDEKFVITCNKKSMPKWIKNNELSEYQPIQTAEYLLPDIDEFDQKSKATAYKRYTMISPILSILIDDKQRKYMISKVAKLNSISTQTVRIYLWKFLVYQNISALTPKNIVSNYSLSDDEKNMKWALNKFFYTQNKNSLNRAYKLMIKEKYCDDNGKIVNQYPSFYQFRYFYRKTKSMQKYYITRNGIKDYEKNNRPLLGEGIHDFAYCSGIGMLDSTICDIYLTDTKGNIIGRPYLTVCIDAYSRICCGYTLTLEGGIYSLRKLMLNVIENKQKFCKKNGINIEKEQWNCNVLPGVLVTDMGTEYKSKNFEQITELGVTLINLPPYRPELKGVVEKFFDTIQNLYKPNLKKCGVIEDDFMERGKHDYRKDACLTLEQFNKVVLQCILFYNSKKVIKKFPYTKEMLELKIPPFPCSIWNYQIGKNLANTIKVSKEILKLSLLPRTNGVFGRTGLKVNKLRYKNQDYTEKYLGNESAIVAYNPDDVSYIWLIENGHYIKFELIEKRYVNKSIEETKLLKQQNNTLINSYMQYELQSEIDLINNIDGIISYTNKNKNVSIKNIRENRKKEVNSIHDDIMRSKNA